MDSWFRTHRRKVPQLNATSTSDISFMLLIFFLVTTSMDVDKGLTRQLPPTDPKEEERSSVVEEGTVMRLEIMADNTLSCDGERIRVETLHKRIEDFVSKVGKEHVIRLQADRNSSYDVYFQVQNEIVVAYNSLRNALALKKYGHSYSECSETEKEQVLKSVPQRIAEAYSSQEGGAE